MKQNTFDSKKCNPVDRMYVMVALRISVLILSLKDGFSNRSVFLKLGKVNLDAWENFQKGAHEDTSFIKKIVELDKKVGARFNVQNYTGKLYLENCA